jgi:hypothetical protein
MVSPGATIRAGSASEPTLDRRYDRMMLTAHLSTPALEAGLEEIRRAPADHGRVELIVRRPATDERELLDEGAGPRGGPGR